MSGVLLLTFIATCFTFLIGALFTTGTVRAICSVMLVVCLVLGIPWLAQQSSLNSQTTGTGITAVNPPAQTIPTQPTPAPPGLIVPASPQFSPSTSEVLGTQNNAPQQEDDPLLRRFTNFKVILLLAVLAVFAVLVYDSLQGKDRWAGFVLLGIVAGVIIAASQRNYPEAVLLLLTILAVFTFFVHDSLKGTKQDKARWAALFLLGTVAMVIVSDSQTPLLERIGATLDEQRILAFGRQLLPLAIFLYGEIQKFPFPFNQPLLLILAAVYAIILASALKFVIKILGFNLKDIMDPFGDYEERKRFRRKTQKAERKIRKELGSKDTMLLMLNNVDKLEKYYRINMDQMVRSFRLSIILIISGIIVIAGTVYFVATSPGSLQGGIAVVSVISGVILEFIGGSALVLYKKNVDEFKEFFKALTRDQDTMLVVELCKRLQDIDKLDEYTEATRHIITYLASRDAALEAEKALPKLEDKTYVARNGKSDSPKE